MENEAVKEIVVKILQLSNTVVGSIIPEEAKRHFRSACKEALLGMVVVLEQIDEKKKNQTSESVHQEKHSSHKINITE